MKEILKNITAGLTTASFALIPSVAILDLNTEANAHVESETGVILLNDEIDGVIELEVLQSGINEDGAVSDDGEVTEGEENGTFLLVRADLLLGAEVDPETGITDPTLVVTSADFELYARTLLLSDENARSVEATDENIQLTYRTRARLFGFIPVLVSTTATVSAEGDVEVTYPWYAFLSATNKTKLEADIAANLQASSMTSISTPSERATALAEIQSAMSANLSGSSEAETEVEIEG